MRPVSFNALGRGSLHSSGAADTELTDDLAEVTMMLKTTEQRLWAIIVAYRI